jgi:hypothetical protein
MREQMDELLRAYISLSELLECTVLSLSARSHLEAYRGELVRNILFLQKSLNEMSANWPSCHR